MRRGLRGEQQRGPPCHVQAVHAGRLALEIGYDAVVGGYIRQFASGAAVTFDTASVRPFLTQKDALVYSVVAGDYNVAYVMPYQAATVFADIDVALNRITAVGHGFATGDRIGVASDGAYPTTVPGGLISSTSELYAIRVDADTFGVATTYANALASVGINITVSPAATLYWAASTCSRTTTASVSPVACRRP